jgi:hypothetical protein
MLPGRKEMKCASPYNEPVLRISNDEGQIFGQMIILGQNGN